MTSSLMSLSRAAALSVAIVVPASSIAMAQTPSPTAAATETAAKAMAATQGRMSSPEDVARALGSDVRVASSSGERRGILVSLSASEVVLRTREGEAATPLAEVRMIRKTSYRVRNGAVGGLLLGVALGVVRSAVGEPLDVPDALSPVIFASLFGGIGAAIGAGIGSGLDAARADRDVIYDAGRSTVLVAPILSPRRAGLALAVRW